jgi:cytochrome c peroxidase
VDGTYGAFQYHNQPFAFGAAEIAGLKIFLSAANNGPTGSPHAGNCAACHLAPNFTDFRFHNTGVSQEEYDAVNDPGRSQHWRFPRKPSASIFSTPTCRPPRNIRMPASGSGTVPWRAIQNLPT